MVELLLLAAEGQAERLCDALEMEFDAQSVSIEDADAHTPAEHALFGEPGMSVEREGWQRSRLSALFADEAAAHAAAALLLAQDWADVRVEAMRPVPEQDWVRLTQSQFQPVEITPSFWVVPSWHAAPAAARQVLRLDPGLAFGTGTHPTTRLCLRWIARHAEGAVHGRRVLDYGCGSGILAIAAALFGAGPIDAVDIDPAAVHSTLDNALANGVPRIDAGLPELAGAPCGAYALVLANILAAPLELLAPLLSAHLAPGGRLVLAGILERQAEKLRCAYAPWLDLTVDASDDGWVLMTAQRAASPAQDRPPSG